MSVVFVIKAVTTLSQTKFTLFHHVFQVSLNERSLIVILVVNRTPGEANSTKISIGGVVFLIFVLFMIRFIHPKLSKKYNFKFI